MIQRLFSETIIRRDNLQKYHLIVVGGIKAAKLAKAFRQYNQYYNVLLVNQHSKQQISQIFNTMTIDPKSILDGTDIAFTDGIGISQINKDSIELINGRQIQFDKIVFTKEYEDIFEINGLEEALSDAYHPVYARTQNYENKNFMDILKFKEGDFYFYIPKRPFDGEDHISYLRLIELLPKEVNLHVISPNENLLGEEQIKQIIERHPNIHFHLNSDITYIDKQTRQVTINDQQFQYDCIYFHGLPQKQLYEQYNNYIVSDSVFEEAKNIIYEFQGQKPLKIKENNQIDNLYIGKYRVQKQFSKPESKVDLVYQKLANSLPAQVWRYLWLTQLNHRLYSTNQLIQSYAKGWKTSRSAPKHIYQKIEVQEIIKPQALPLIYKFSKQQINNSLIKNIISSYNLEQDNKTDQKVAKVQKDAKILKAQVEEVPKDNSKDDQNITKVSKEKVQQDSTNGQILKNQAEAEVQQVSQQISKQEESVTIKQNISSPPQPETPQQNQQEAAQPAKKQRKRKSK